jgi:uncharacterized damage-inducible protein DinB
MIDTALASWRQAVAQANETLNTLTDDQFRREVAPGKNRVQYPLGHLTAVNDATLTILGLGDRLHPELDVMFIKNSDKVIKELPTAANLKKYWAEVKQNVLYKMEALSSREWLQRRCTMTDEDLTKSATRNRLNILLSRARHVSYHMGQVALARSQQRGQTSRSETKNYA